MNKRILIILGVIIVLSFAAGALVLFSGSPTEEPVAIPPGPEIKELVDERAIAPISSFDGNAVWYFTANGRLFRVNTDGSGLSEFPLPQLTSGNLVDVAWPIEGNDFIAITATSAGEVKNYYDSVQKKYVALPANIQSFDWLPDGKRIAYVWKSGDNATQQLVMANADGTGFRTIKNVFWPDLQVKASPLGKEVLLIRSMIEGQVNKIYRANLETGAIDIVIDEGRNLDALWLPGGEKFIFAQDNITRIPRLFLYNFSSRQVVDLNVNTTLDKVVVNKDGKYLYAAAPKKDNTGDEFVKLDLATYKLETYFDPGEDLRAKNLIMVGNNLYFVNSRDGKIYYISK